MNPIHTTTISAILACGTVASAATINIDGRLADSTENSAMQWGNNSLLADNVTIPQITVADSTVELKATTNGQFWSTSYSAGSYNPGEEWNIRQATDSGVVAKSLAAAFSGGRFIEFSLTTLNPSDVYDWDSISVSLWRNGSQAPDNYLLAVDADNNGWDTGDVVTSAVFGSGIAGANTLSYSGANLPSAVNSGSVRLYYWDNTATSNTGGNFHLYDVSATYTLVPEPSATALLSLCFAGILFRRRRS